MPTRRLYVGLVACALLLGGLRPSGSRAADRVPLTIEAHVPGAPITVGIPFPKGALDSPDHVRLLTPGGEEVPAQVTEVTSWAPADSSVKWAWVFFFAEHGNRYVVEYGPEVRRAPITGDRVTVVNDQREGGFAEITTGPLRVRLQKSDAEKGVVGSGFLDVVSLDSEGDGFEAGDVIARGPEGRGSFLDLVDPHGRDSSRAVVTQTFKEKGSGPLHAIVRVEGRYVYDRADHPPSPFTLRIHAYAGRSTLRVLHTLTYTGDPDRRPPVEGQHALIATGPDNIVDEDRLVGDPRWMQPNDRIAGTGLALSYQLDGPLQHTTALQSGDWHDPDPPRRYRQAVEAQEHLSVFQTGPKPTRIPPVPNASPTERIGGFEAQVWADSTRRQRATRAAGWMDVTGARHGIAVGIRHFLKEYPKELSLRPTDSTATAYAWSPMAPPMSFARADSAKHGGMVDNFATGLAKTTESVYAFHDARTPIDSVHQKLQAVLDPPVAHAPPQWYSDSRVYGHFAPRSDDFPAYERGLDYKFHWWRFNQSWEPWYGMFDSGDGKTYYFRDRWYLWTNNEPATDFMGWLQFMRTGKRENFLMAEATSRHTMDVDNIHWPADSTYRGDTNSALDFFRAEKRNERAPATPYLGMGRRHAPQHWTELLSAHVWVPGWLAAYYLDGMHRGLDIARLTADYYHRRIFGEHGLTGRRLYLSIWNLVEIWDATKADRHRRELDDRIDRLLRLQDEQGGNLVIDRYGYAQPYLARGLTKYHQMTGDAEVRRALVRHARWVRDNPPLNHEMESYLASISPLMAGYNLSGEPSLFREAVRRAQALKTDALPDALETYRTQKALAEALESASRLPDGRDGRPGIWRMTGGLRVFGWTHFYNVPWLIHALEQNGEPDIETSPLPATY